MIIEAKATKAEETGEQGAERFRFSPERLTRIPVYFAMAVVGLAAFLRSAFPAQAAVAPAQPTPDGPLDGNGAPLNWCLPGDEPLSASLDQPVDETVTGSIGGAEAPRNQVGRGGAWPGPFVPAEQPNFHFMAPPDYVLPSIAPFFPGAFASVGMNDNLGFAPPSTGTNPGPSITQPPTQPSGPTDPDDDGEDDDEDDDDTEGPGNRAPVVLGPVRLNDVFAGQVILIGLSQLLFGASDPDGDPLNVLNLKVTGTTLVRVQDGWQITTQPGMLGPVTLTYKVSDGEAWVTQTAFFDIVRKQHVLTPGDDTHVGNPYDDDIDGLGGDDIIDSLDGNDLVVGGDGDDHIHGGTGDDHLFGGNGNDVLMGGDGDDQLWGEAGDDRLFGGNGDDTIDGGSGDDIAYGGRGNDIIDGGQGDDDLFGDAGNDVMEGGDGCDLLVGGDGTDVLMGQGGDDRLEGGADADLLGGGGGNDLLRGGAGNDTLDGGAGCDVVEGGSDDDRLIADKGDDMMSGGDGEDTLDFSAACLGMVFDMAAGKTYSDEFGNDSFDEIEAATAGAGDDMFIIGATATIASGGRGRDTFIFEVTDEKPALSDDIVHDILDFVVGDRIRVRDYEIDREAKALEADTFRRIYDDDDDDWLKSDLPIVVQHVRYDDVDNTIIKADLDRDDRFEVTIFIHGIHLPIDPSTSVA